MEDYWLWLCCQKELYRPHIAKLIQYFGSPREVFQASGKALQDSGCLTGKQVTGLLKSRAGWDKEETRHQLERKGISFISAGQEEFPKRLKGIPDCPFGIFFKGKLPEDDRKTVGIVGARRCSYYGKQMAERLAAALAECGAVVVSGMALGIDGYAQTAALEAGG